ncbi:MAG: helix-turn-helix transcriptional regulator [Ignavibacteriales bacterium]|nr:MAG: helix-turn-helix transcriptional regulator [Ignavibacteriales bacterium]
MISQSNTKLDSIFRSALELFAENGIDATPTALIAARAGVANGTLFHYFKTKEELIQAIYSETRKEMLGAALAGLDETQPLFVTLHGMRDALFSWSLANQNAVRFLIQYEASPVFLRNPVPDQLAGVLDALIRLGISKGELGQIPEEVHRKFIMNYLTAMMRDAVTPTEQNRGEELMEISFILLQRALRQEKKK